MHKVRNSITSSLAIAQATQLVLYIAIVGDFAPQVDLISSIEMTPLVTYSTPLFSRDLMVSIYVLRKTCSGAKNSRMGTLSGKISKKFLKTLE
jgi:hypothetical protein